MTTVTPGIGPRMLNSRPVIPADLHVAFCGWRTRTPDDVEPDVAWCAGCGLPISRGVASDPAVSMTTTKRPRSACNRQTEA